MRKYIIAILSLLFFGCTKESIIQGITVAPEKSITNKINVNGQQYNIYSAYKSTFLSSTCTGRGLGSFIIRGAKEGTADTAVVFILNLTNFNSTYQIFPYGNTGCLVNAFLGLWNGPGDVIFYDSNTTGKFIIDDRKFKLDNTQFTDGNTTLIINSEGSY